MGQVHTVTELQEMLDVKGIDTSQWGTGSAKSVEDLLNEISEGETLLQDAPLVRIVSGVTQVIVRKGESVLMEAEQEFEDGRTRTRNFPPSEKMKPGESYLDAARRCLKEELGVSMQSIEILESTYRQERKTIESPSYPGLRTVYTFHIVEAIVNGLPDSDFWIVNEAVYSGKDPVKRHHWIWKAQSSTAERL